MPAIQPCIVEPIWEQFSTLLPERKTDHPLDCHRRRIPNRVVPQEAGVVHRETRAGHRLLGRLFRGGHHRRPIHPKSLDTMPLGDSAFLSTMTYCRKL